MTERDERALRQALEDLGSDDPVDLDQVRSRAGRTRRNRRTVAGLAVALVLVVGVVGLPQLMAGGGSQPTSMAGGAEAGAGSQAGEDAGTAAEPEGAPQERQVAPTDAPPAGWRTEYYRDVSFAVPADWGYAVPPQSDWCADEPRGEPRADQRRPYVWLSTHLLVRSIGCGETRPASLLTEHVEALTPGPAVDYVEGTVREGEWWIVTRFAGAAVLVVTTKDEELAEQILDSARVQPENAPCEPASPVAGPIGTRPDQEADLAELGPVDRVVICQYQPVEDPGDAALPRLRAVRQLTGNDGQVLVDQLRAAPANNSRCDPEPIDRAPQLALSVRIWVGGEVHEVFVNPSGCPDGDPGMYGGIDDGVTVRILTRPACQALLTPPIALYGAGSDVAGNCLG